MGIVSTPPEGYYVVHSDGKVVDNPRDWTSLIHCRDCGYCDNNNYCEFLRRNVYDEDYCSYGWGAGDDTYSHPFAPEVKP